MISVFYDRTFMGKVPVGGGGECKIIEERGSLIICETMAMLGGSIVVDWESSAVDAD